MRCGRPEWQGNPKARACSAALVARTVKNLDCKAGDSGSVPGVAILSEEGNGHHSNILVRRIPVDRVSLTGHIQSDRKVRHS